MARWADTRVPVCDASKQDTTDTYERTAIEGWVATNGTSPTKRKALRIANLYPNNAIKTLLEEEKRKDESQMHPSVRKWKNEKPPKRPVVVPTAAVTPHAANDTTEAGRNMHRNLNRQQEAEARGCRRCLIALLLYTVAIVVFLIFLAARR